MKTFDFLLDEIENEFNDMKWIKYKRKNVSHLPCYSMTFGEVMRAFHGRSPSASNIKFPKLFQLLQELWKTLNFTHSSYTIKNLECLPHKDK